MAASGVSKRKAAVGSPHSAAGVGTLLATSPGGDATSCLFSALQELFFRIIEHLQLEEMVRIIEANWDSAGKFLLALILMYVPHHLKLPYCGTLGCLIF